jgi:beta-lactamase regulating signal transducer with metallopeptidase domain
MMMLEKFIADFVQSSLISSIGILIVIILRKGLLLKYTKKFFYYIWLIIIVKLLIPFKVPIYISPQIYIVWESFINTISFNQTGSKISLYQGDAVTIISNYHNNYIVKIIAAIWLIGVIVLTIYYLYTYLKFIINIKYVTYDVNDNEMLNIYTELICELKINKKIHLKYYEGINSPFGMGFLNPCIVIPNNAYNSTELKLILKHELIHFKNHDLLYKIILVFVKILHWFNPLVYIMCKIINSDCELACDELLLKDSGVEERKLYAMTLVNSLRFNKKDIFESGIVTSFNKNQNKNILKRRLENMLNLNGKKRGVLIGSIATVIIASSLISVNVFAEKNTNKVAQTPNKVEVTNINKVAQTPNKIKVTNINEDIQTTKGIKVVYSGTAADMPKEYVTDEQFQFHNSNPDTKAVIVTGFIQYTYANAPAQVKLEYEADCKAVNKTPSPSDTISIPEK